MKLAVIGSRNFNDYELLVRELDKFNISERVSGGARGADQMAARYARERNIPLKEYLPEYNKYGRAAPHVRNTIIIKNCDQLVAFWNGTSPGTRSTFNKAKKASKIVHVINF